MDQYQWNLAFKMSLKAFVIIVALSVTKSSVLCKFGFCIAQAMPDPMEFTEFQQSHTLF